MVDQNNAMVFMCSTEHKSCIKYRLDGKVLKSYLWMKRQILAKLKPLISMKFIIPSGGPEKWSAFCWPPFSRGHY